MHDIKSTLTLLSILLLLLLPMSTLAAYTLTDNYSKDTFFGNFTAFAAKDPTNGFVTYQPYPAAAAQSLIHTVPNALSASYISVDPSTTTNAGRSSVRISSTKSFNSGSLFIVDLLHMPKNTCGSWPAFWLLGPDWPNGGEVDIVEGVNDQEYNQMTLHTAPGCKTDTNVSGGFRGKVGESKECGPGPGGENTGCAIMSPAAENGGGGPYFGDGFNRGNGGVYATEWTSDHIAIWFFPRNAIPMDIASEDPKPDPTKWGVPLARWAKSGCDIDKYFKDMKIVFNTAFCGDWAGKVWASGGCAKKTGVSTCEEYVRRNGGEFKESFWLVNYVRVFQQGAGQGQQQQQQQQQSQGGGKMRRGERIVEIVEEDIES